MTEKEFLDVFPQLKVEPQLEELLKTVKVRKVAVNPQKDCLRVYIVSSQWIQKKYIYDLEASIKEQFFQNAPLKVKIIEKFQLSRQYTPENFLAVYRPSILLELKQYSILEYNMFATADIRFSDPETMELLMTDSVIAREREHELIRVLEKIFCERCGFNLKVYPSYHQPVESKVRKNSELRIMERGAPDSSAFQSRAETDGNGFCKSGTGRRSSLGRGRRSSSRCAEWSPEGCRGRQNSSFRKRDAAFL